MRCTECGAEVSAAAFYCGGCGKPVGFPMRTATLTREATIDEVPAPGAPRERPPQRGSPSPGEPSAKRSGRALCSLCMGSFPESVMSRVDGHAYCPDCSPLTGRRAEPEPAVAAMPAPVSGGPRAFAPAPPVLLTPRSGRRGGARAVVALVALLLAAAVGWGALAVFGKSRIDRIIGEVDRSPRPGRLLYSKYVPGECLDYTLSGRMTGEISLGPLGGLLSGKDLEIDMTATGGFAADVLSVDDRGNGEVRISWRTMDFGGKALLDGRDVGGGFPADLPFLPGANGDGVTLRIDPYGRPLDGAPGAVGVTGLLGGELGHMPERSLKVGDEWSARETIPGGQFGDLAAAPAIEMAYRVEGYRKLRGRECMVISIRGELSGGAVRQAGMSLDLEMEIEGVMFFDPEGGRLVKSAADIDLAAGMEGPGGDPLEAKLRIELDVDLR